MKRIRLTMIVTSASIFWVTSLAMSPANAEEQTPQPSLQSVLAAHRTWSTTPDSIEIIGTSTTAAKDPDNDPLAKDGKIIEPVRILVTRGEEAATEYGTLKEVKVVATPSRNFRDDGAKVTSALTQAGFAQMDVTGVFLLAYAAAGEAKLAPAAAQEGFTAVLTVDRGRTELHYGQFKVSDAFAIYLGRDGLLAAISRSFYPKASQRHYTQAYTFADYRDTGGVLLPYRIAHYRRGKLVQTIEVASYQFNVAADPALFVPGSVR